MFIACVGKPSVGKSTFFRAATLAEAEIANYPFTTINPNEAVAYVKIECVDKEFNKQCNPREGYCLKHNRFIPFKLVDVAGLVPGSHEGKGMGNQFLNDLSGADLLIHVIDISGSVNEKGEPVEPLSYDPANDIEFLETELNMWFLGLIQKGWEKFARQVMQEKADIPKALSKFLTGLKITEELVKDALKKLTLPEQINTWSESHLTKLAIYLRERTKPIIIAANKIDVKGADQNLERIKKQFTNYTIITTSAESELALREAAKHHLIDYVPGENNFEIKDKTKLSEKQIKALNFIKENIIDKHSSTGVQQVLDSAVFNLLKYMAIYPGSVNNLTDSKGNTLPDCFLMPPNTTALDFAFKLHTDFGKNFIRAIDVKTKRVVGKDHLLKNRDVIELVTNK